MMDIVSTTFTFLKQALVGENSSDTRVVTTAYTRVMSRALLQLQIRVTSETFQEAGVHALVGYKPARPHYKAKSTEQVLNITWDFRRLR